MATRAEIQAAIEVYQQRGNADAVRKLTATLKAMPADRDGQSFSAPKAAPQSTGIRRVGEEIVGGIETAGTIATGAVVAPVVGLGAGIAETARQILAGNSVESGTPGDRAVIAAAERGAESVTYLPRTEAGKRQVQAIGAAIEPVADDLPALTPLAGEGAAISQAVRYATSATRAAADSTGVPTAVARTTARATDAAKGAAERAGITKGRPAIVFDEATVGRGEPLQPGQTVVRVDPRKLIEEHGRVNPDYAKYDKTAGVKEFAKNNKVSMAEVDAPDGIVSFTNGRNRVKVAADAGMRDIPVATFEPEKLAKFAPDSPSAAPAAGPGPAGPRSAGAAEVSPADVRRAGAAELGFKDDARLTKGQATQEPTEIGFEREQAKSIERGPELRQRFENQARRAEQVFDDFVDQTGGSVPDFSGGGKVGLGQRIGKALGAGAEKQKNAVRAAFAKAQQAEGGLPTSGGTITQYLDDNVSARGTAPILKAAAAEAKRLGIATKEGAGAITDIKTLYELRKFISKNAGNDGANSYHAGELKKLIDARIAEDGGPLYRQATEAHARFKSQYSDASLINGILENKPGSPDRIIAADQVLNRVIADGTSVDEIKHMRRLLQTHGGEEGAAAYRDLQAGVIEYLRDATYKGARSGPNGTLRPNATQLNNAVSKLDKAGKLDVIFGKQGADKVRLFRDIVRSITNEEGANYTNNAGPIIEFLESIPVAGNTVAKGRKLAASLNSVVRDRKLRARIKENLE